MVENIVFLILSGLVLRFSLSITGQNWVKTYQQTIAFLILPVVTYVITKTITGNIALSLGMIGALSIVRFRNPVKNPFELVMFFSLITLGIVATVSRNVFILFLVFLKVDLLFLLLLLFVHYQQEIPFLLLQFADLLL